MNASLILLAVVGFPALLVLSSMWRGYVLSVLWGWFAVPYLGAPPIGVAAAIGISLLVGMLTNHRTGNEATKDGSTSERLLSAMAIALIAPALTLLFGWIVTKFL